MVEVLNRLIHYKLQAHITAIIAILGSTSDLHGTPMPDKPKILSLEQIVGFNKIGPSLKTLLMISSHPLIYDHHWQALINYHHRARE